MIKAIKLRNWKSFWLEVRDMESCGPDNDRWRKLISLKKRQ